MPFVSVHKLLLLVNVEFLCKQHWFVEVQVLAAFGGLYCYGASSTAALWWRSDDCASATEAWIVPLGTFVCQTWSVSASSWALNHLHAQYTRNNVFGISHSPSVNTKNMASIFVRVEICAALFSGQQIVFCLTPYDTPRATPCKKAEFHIHRRHAAGGAYKQRMTALQNYIYRCTYTYTI